MRSCVYILTKKMIVAIAYKLCKAASALKAMLDGFTKFGSTLGGGGEAGRLYILSLASGDKGVRPILVSLGKIWL
jgi:hypothetical protein